MGTSAATGRPRRVIIVDWPPSAPSRSEGSSFRASSDPLWRIFIDSLYRLYG